MIFRRSSHAAHLLLSLSIASLLARPALGAAGAGDDATTEPAAAVTTAVAAPAGPAHVIMGR